MPSISSTFGALLTFDAARNDPYKDAQHPRYTPLAKVDDAAIKRIGMKRFEAGKDDNAWLRSDTDRTAGHVRKLNCKLGEMQKLKPE